MLQLLEAIITQKIGFYVIEPGDGIATFNYTPGDNGVKPKYLFYTKKPKDGKTSFRQLRGFAIEYAQSPLVSAQYHRREGRGICPALTT